ncbi:MAG TPA: nucleotidyltransferase domain-containing protein [Armatimonadota bacterium]|jgi:predicted nucleotidyltransferase
MPSLPLAAVHFDPERLAAVAQELNLRLVILHGSRAEGREEGGSDIDLAILAAGKVDIDRRLLIFRRLSAEVTGAPLDISLLNGAQPNFLAVVAETGLPLWEAAPNEFLRFCSLAARIYADSAKWQDAQWQHLNPD